MRGWVHVDSEGATFQVRVTPRAGRDEVGPVINGSVRVKVAAAAYRGEANRAVVALLARTLDVPKSAVRILKGASGRLKTVRVLGADRRAIEEPLLALSPP